MLGRSIHDAAVYFALTGMGTVSVGAMVVADTRERVPWRTHPCAHARAYARARTHACARARARTHAGRRLRAGCCGACIYAIAAAAAATLHVRCAYVARTLHVAMHVTLHVAKT